MVLRVDLVQVSATRPGTTEPWDGPAPESDSDAICSLFAWGAAAATTSPVTGKAVGALCDLESRAPQAERDATNPDLQLRLSAGASTHFDSFVERDSLSHVFHYEFVVPTKAIPPDGIRLEVLDADTNDSGETIGSVRISSDMVAQALFSETHLLNLPGQSVTRLELVVTPYVPAGIPKVLMAPNEPPRLVPVRPLVAGEVVILTAKGSYTVGKWTYTDAIGPAGYPNDEARGYNFKQEPFASAPHACAIALVKSGAKVEGVVVGRGTQFTATYAGSLSVGVNDEDSANNQGWLAFQGSVRAPTVHEWLQSMDVAASVAPSEFQRQAMLALRRARNLPTPAHPPPRSLPPEPDAR